MSKAKKAKKVEAKVVESERQKNSVNKAELVDLIAEKSGLTKADSTKALNAVLESVSETLSKGQSVTLVGFGTFSVKDRAERQGFNPQTKEPIKIPATKVASFKAGQKLKDAVGG